MENMNNQGFPGVFGAQTHKVTKVIVMTLFFVSAFFFVRIASDLKSYNLIGSGTTATNVISVSGTGDAFAVPDIATISFTVEKQEKTVADAQKYVDDNMKAALDFVKSSGIDEKDIQLTNNSFYPQYDYGQPCVYYPCPTKTPTIIGYQVSRTITLKVRKTDDAGAIVEGLGKLNVSNLNGPTFTVDSEDAVKAEARKIAINDAKTKAESLAKDLGVTLVRIVNFSENGNTPYPLMYAKADMAYGMGGASAPAAPELPKGQNKYTSDVMITYEIR